MERIEPGEPPLILGDGPRRWTSSTSRDIARANILAAEADVTDDVFNVASGVETSLRELAEALLEVMGPTSSPSTGPSATVNAVTRRLADTSKAARGTRLPGRDRARARACTGSSTGGGPSGLVSVAG